MSVIGKFLAFMPPLKYIKPMNASNSLSDIVQFGFHSLANDRVHVLMCRSSPSSNRSRNDSIGVEAVREYGVVPLFAVNII